MRVGHQRSRDPDVAAGLFVRSQSGEDEESGDAEQIVDIVRRVAERREEACRWARRVKQLFCLYERHRVSWKSAASRTGGRDDVFDPSRFA